MKIYLIDILDGGWFSGLVGWWEVLILGGRGSNTCPSGELMLSYQPRVPSSLCCNVQLLFTLCAVDGGQEWRIHFALVVECCAMCS